MAADRIDPAANIAAEEVLRVIYGDDLEGCNVSVDQIAGAIGTALREQHRDHAAVAELYTKAFEAVQLLATPPADAQGISPEELRSLLGERLDKIRELAVKVRSATGRFESGEAATTSENGRDEST